VRVPTEEIQLRAIHRQREQLVKARKQIRSQGAVSGQSRLGAGQNWWKARTFAALASASLDQKILAK